MKRKITDTYLDDFCDEFTASTILKNKENVEISEDEYARLEKQIQEKVDGANKTIDEVTKNKETEISTI